MKELVIKANGDRELDCWDDFPRSLFVLLKGSNSSVIAAWYNGVLKRVRTNCYSEIPSKSSTTERHEETIKTLVHVFGGGACLRALQYRYDVIAGREKRRDERLAAERAKQEKLRLRKITNDEARAKKNKALADEAERLRQQRIREEDARLAFEMKVQETRELMGRVNKIVDALELPEGCSDVTRLNALMAAYQIELIESIENKSKSTGKIDPMLLFTLMSRREDKSNSMLPLLMAQGGKVDPMMLMMMGGRL